MAKQVVKNPQEMLEEVVSEETDTKLETKSAVWNQRINLELTQRTMRKTEKKISENGKEQRKIEIDEDTDRSIVSYPSPEKIYSEEADRVTAEIQQDKNEENKRESGSRPQLVLVKLDLSRPSRDLEVVEVEASAKELAPTTRVVKKEETAVEQSFKVEEVEGFSFEVATERIPTVEEEPAGKSRYEAEGQAYEEDDTESFSTPESPVERPSTPEFEEYYTGSILEPETSGQEEDYGRLSPLLEDFENPEEYENLSDAIFHAEYSEDSEVSERLVMDLDSMFPYQDSVSGSEAVEALWSDYGVEATVAEVPYFSENSGDSWEEGWNSFDMVMQMNGMSMLDTEYLSGDLYKLGDLDQPAQRSIGSDFSTDQAIEFRESEEFSSHTGGYEASERTKEAWVERYGEEILELDGIERGVYAAFEEDRNFRGAEMRPEETEILSDSAVEML